MTTGHRSFRRIRKLLVPLLIFLLKVDHSQGRTIGRRPEGFEALSEHLLDKSQRIQVSYKSATTSHINFPRDLDNAEYQSDRIAKEYDPAKFDPIKIKFETTSFEDTLSKSNKNTKIRGQAILDKVLPHVLALWQSTLAVYPTRGFKLPSVACGAPEFTIPETMSNVIYDTDLIVFVGAFDTLFDIKFCNSKDPALSTLAVSSPCHLDERNRPVIGYVNICLNVMEIHNGQVPPKVVESMTDVVVHELGHILGVNRIMFKYFVDAETGRPHTPQPFQTALAKCVNGQVDQIMEMPCNNTLVYHEEHISNGRGAIELRGYYEVVLPNVRQVVRNQFNCSSLSGARMENQPTSEDCIGSHFDERFFYSEFMSAIYDEGSAVFSPLTLAFLEDSGFYRVNFRNSKNSPFGLGAGCDFVLKDCIVNGTIPEYGKGYFCNERHDTNKGGPWACGPSHNYRGYCDLSTKAWPARTYFEKYVSGFNSNSTLGCWISKLLNLMRLYNMVKRVLAPQYLHMPITVHLSLWGTCAVMIFLRMHSNQSV
jgi:leishmanolysin-like peptidase